MSHRYEWLNGIESVQWRLDKEAKEAKEKSKNKKKKKQEEEEATADRATLWQALLHLDNTTKGKLENLYWEQVPLHPPLSLHFIFLSLSWLRAPSN
jgi:hypothetical protein